MKALRTIVLTAALALIASAPAAAQVWLVNPCGTSDTCLGTGDARDVFIVGDGAKRIRIKFDGTQIDPMVDAVTSLGTSTRRFKDAQFSGTVTGGTFSGAFSGTFGDGTEGAPSITFTNDTNTGWYRSSNDSISTTLGGTRQLYFGSSGGEVGLSLRSTVVIGWTSGDPGSSRDLILARDAANALAQRNSTTAQAFRIYNTFTDSSNYERLDLAFSGGNPVVSTSRLGTGSARTLILRGNAVQFVSAEGTHNWTLNSSGHIVAGTDNTYDFGASGATRPRTGYFGTSIVAPTATLSASISIFTGRTNDASEAALTVERLNGSDIAVFNNNGTTQFGGSIQPTTNNAFDAGASGARWANGYFGNSVDVGTGFVTSGSYRLNASLLDSSTAPTVASGFGTSPSITANGTAAFSIDVGTGGTATDGVLTMPAASNGWVCHVENITATAANRADQRTVQIARTTTSVTIENQTVSTGAALAWAASDILLVSCRAY